MSDSSRGEPGVTRERSRSRDAPGGRTLLVPSPSFSGLLIPFPTLQSRDAMEAAVAACSTLVAGGIEEDRDLFVEVESRVFVLEFICEPGHWKVDVHYLSEPGASRVRQALSAGRETMPCWNTAFEMNPLT